jgi:hypothetical protein
MIGGPDADLEPADRDSAMSMGGGYGLLVATDRMVVLEAPSPERNQQSYGLIPSFDPAHETLMKTSAVIINIC